MSAEYEEAKRKFQSLRTRLRSAVSVRDADFAKNLDVALNAVRTAFRKDGQGILVYSRRRSTEERIKSSTIGSINLNPGGNPKKAKSVSTRYANPSKGNRRLSRRSKSSKKPSASK